MTTDTKDSNNSVAANGMQSGSRVCEIESLRNRREVFSDRIESGKMLTPLLTRLKLNNPLILAIPAGGVPVGIALAGEMNCRLDVAVVSKITLPWNTEAGYGAVAFDGSYRLNHKMLHSTGLSEHEIGEGLAQTRAKVERRVESFRRGRPLLELKGREVIVVDDGLASGFTMLVAVEAVRRSGAGRVVVAVPTGHEASVLRLAEEVDAVCCANIRGGPYFAVASAYRYWSDVAETEALKLLETFQPE